MSRVANAQAGSLLVHGAPDSSVAHQRERQAVFVASKGQN